jgi:hypothetical protein
MYQSAPKKSSSWTVTSIQKKSKNFSQPGSSAVQPKREALSDSQDASYSTIKTDLLTANIMRSLETQELESSDPQTVQRQSSSGGAALTLVAPPIVSTPVVQSNAVGIQRLCNECASEQQEKSGEEGKDVLEMSFASSGIQTKLTVGTPGDVYEQEADRMAQQVMSMSVAATAPPQVQRFGEEPSPVGMYSSLAQSITPVVHRRVDEQVQMQSLVQRAFQAGGNEASGDLESRLNASKGGGSALAPEVRAFMEPRFGADFSGVRVHTGGEAVQMNRELGAQAFAHGSDIYFGAGKSPGNNELTAHELTHVVQQTGGIQTKLKSIQRQPSPPQPGPWNPPGNQPIPFYMGNQAHIGIAAQYVAAHPGNVVFANFVPILTILQALRRMGLNPNAGTLSTGQQGLKPDILNASLRHLYEIKPESAQNQALTEAQMYVGLFARAGITIALGSINEPGTRGLIPAPGGFYVFWSPVPGVIVYRYGRQPQPVPVPAQQPSTARQPQSNQDFMQRMAKLTGLTGTALIIYLIFSEGSRLFPPRNLVPVP